MFKTRTAGSNTLLRCCAVIGALLAFNHAAEAAPGTPLSAPIALSPPTALFARASSGTLLFGGRQVDSCLVQPYDAIGTALGPAQLVTSGKVQSCTALAVDGNGLGALLYQSREGVGNLPEFYFTNRLSVQRLQADATVNGAAIEVAHPPVNHRIIASDLAMNTAGAFAVCWIEQYVPAPGSSYPLALRPVRYTVKLQMYRSDGSPNGSAKTVQQLSTLAWGSWVAPGTAEIRLSITDEGSVAVVWLNPLPITPLLPAGTYYQGSPVYARRYDATAQASGRAFVVDRSTPRAQGLRIAGSPEGDVLIGWTGITSNKDGSSSLQPSVVRYDANGSLLGDKQILSDHGSDLELAAGGGGSYVLAWANTPDTDPSGAIYAQFFARSGAAASDRFTLVQPLADTSLSLDGLSLVEGLPLAARWTVYAPAGPTAYLGFFSAE